MVRTPTVLSGIRTGMSYIMSPCLIRKCTRNGILLTRWIVARGKGKGRIPIPISTPVLVSSGTFMVLGRKESNTSTIPTIPRIPVGATPSRKSISVRDTIQTPT